MNTMEREFGASRNTLRHRSCRSWHAGFTLVELLVVISIIALLISILLPSLKAAREQAKQLKCQSNQAGIAKAAATYETEWNDWLPGSPGTTGSILIGNYASEPGNSENIPVPPTQVWDYAGPLASVQMNMSLRPNRAERFEQVIEGIFECPSNNHLSVPYPAPVGNWHATKLVSYNTPRNFMYWSSNAPFSDANWPTGWPTRPPGDAQNNYYKGKYSPRVDRAGQPSEKIFTTDSSRFTTDDAKLDFDFDWRATYGGSFSTGGPTLQYQPGNPDRSYLRSFLFNDPQRRYSYRHGSRSKPGIVVGYFDGHAGYLSESQSRFPDPWWPKGTLIPRSDLNKESRQAVAGMLIANRYYVVRR